MENKPYLIFSLHDSYYGVDALLVQEIFYLPELTPVIEAPDEIVGVLNLRSKLLPVMHLDLRLGQQLQKCRLSDSIIVLEWEGLQIGIIVNSVHEVKNISLEAIESGISYGRGNINSGFIAGIAKVEAELVMLLNIENLLWNSDLVETLLLEEPNELTGECINQLKEKSKEFGESKKINDFYQRCCPNATLEEKVIFWERAEYLRQSPENSDCVGFIPIAVIGLNDEYFGLNLEVVREFTNISNVTLIPCCPAHIIGNMNLRGEIVTLVDIRSALNLPIAINKASKAIVICVDDVVVGLPVDEVFDVMYLRTSEMKSIPIALHCTYGEYLRGTAAYTQKMLSVLDLHKLLTSGKLAVNEEV